MLMALVNDILDLKLIEDGLFMPKIEPFKPWNVLSFIQGMFNGLSNVSNTKIEVDYFAE